MTRLMFLFALMLAFGLSMATAAEIKPVADGNAAFAFDLYAKLKGEKGNFFYSPFSISAALSMTSTGAMEETLKQMTKTLHLPANPHPGFGELIAKLNAADPKAYQLSVANSLFGQKGYPWLPSFLDVTNKYYQAGLKEVDYMQPEGARKQINDWVETKTNKKITDLMPAGSIGTDTRLVLVNAIYFKGNWNTPFDAKKTQKAAFHVSATEQADVQMMSVKNHFHYFENADMQLVAMPYAKNELSFVILLPRKQDGIADLEKKYTGNAISQWMNLGSGTPDVTVQMPKFKLEAKFDLGDQLAAMGMSDAFSANKANFAGMDGKRDLYIQKVIHKSFIEVNEEGTEAAAATGIAMAMKAMPAPKAPLIVRCDHPFTFMIVDNATSSVLFAGRYGEPK